MTLMVTVRGLDFDVPMKRLKALSLRPFPAKLRVENVKPDILLDSGPTLRHIQKNKGG